MTEVVEKAEHIMCDPEDYTVEYDGQKWWILHSKRIRHLKRFVNEEQANKWIEAHCTLKETKVRLYHDFCHCGCPVEGWEYVKHEGLIFERCKRCGNPLRHNIMLRFQAKLAENFDLDAFLEE